METQPIKRRLLTDPEAAAYLGMSISFLRQGRMEGRRANRSPGPPFIRMGKAIRYDIQDLDAWLSANRCEVA
ncbi:MAG: helix-turn-helix domain-containing protein [Candidatus Competibacteraceae bacterium]|nr:helix-turn-helix domain-containing protein [Candidatus Competibacteraceae bacterium]